MYGLPPGSPGYTPAGQGIGTGKSESNKILMIVGIVVGGVFLLGVLAVGCVVLVASGGSGKPTAREVCEKLVEQGIARNCRSATPRGMSASARDRYDFSLASLPSRTGTALTMSSRADYDRVVDLYRATAILTGPHRYGSARALVFVTLDEKASTSVGNRTRDVVDGL